MSGAEETLQRIEELLALLLESIRRLERRLDSLSLTEEASVAYELASLFSLPTSAAIEAAKKLLSVLGFSSHIGLMCFHRLIFLPPHPARGRIRLRGVQGHPRASQGSPPT